MRAARWLIAVAVLAVLAMVAWIVVPRVVRAQLDHVFAATFTQPPSVGRIAFNPFTLKLTVERFRLPATGDAVASFERLRVSFDLLSPFRGAITSRMVEVDRPEARLALERDGTLNVAQLLKPPPTKSAEPPSLRFLRIAVTGGMVQWQDRIRTSVLTKTVDSLAITLNDFSTEKGTT